MTHRLTQGGPFLWERTAWPDNLVWDDAVVVPALSGVRVAHGRLLGKASLVGLADRQQLEAEAFTDEGVQTARIEGDLLDRASVRSSVLRHLGLPDAAPRRSGRSVDGLVDMLLDAARHADEPLTIDRLCAWHSGLFPTGRSGIHEIRVGAFRIGDEPMQVVSRTLEGPVVHFEAPPSARVEDEVRTFLHWFERHDAATDPVLRACLAHLRFVTIHPFDDGNGRVARAITDLMLSRGEAGPHRLWSLSAQIERERTEYYRQLEQAQRGEGDVTPFVAWHLGCIRRALEQAERTVDAVLDRARFWVQHSDKPMNDRQRKLVTRLLDAAPQGFEGGMTTRKAAALTGVSKATAQRDLAELVRWGVLRPRPARGRSAAYDLEWPDR